MRKLIAGILLLFGTSTGYAQQNPGQKNQNPGQKNQNQVPEIDPTKLPAAIALLGGTTLIIRGTPQKVAKRGKMPGVQSQRKLTADRN